MVALIWAKLGKWVALIGGAIVVLFAALLDAHHRGAVVQATKDAKRDAQADTQAQVQAAQETQSTVADASAAADQVQQTAATQPAPDPATRTDFDGTF